MRKGKLAIFDIDGTLHHTEFLSKASFGSVLPKYGLKMPSDEVFFSAFGCPTEEILDILGLRPDPALRAHFLEDIDDADRREMIQSARVYDGAIEGLRQIHDRGVSLALCSLCGPPYMEVFEARFGISEMISYRRNELDGPDKRALVASLLEESKPEFAVMVGDRKFDMEAARANSIPFVGCAYGYAPEEITGADVRVKSAHEMIRAVVRLLSV